MEITPDQVKYPEIKLTADQCEFIHKALHLLLLNPSEGGYKANAQVYQIAGELTRYQEAFNELNMETAVLKKAADKRKAEQEQKKEGPTGVVDDPRKDKPSPVKEALATQKKTS